MNMLDPSPYMGIQASTPDGEKILFVEMQRGGPTSEISKKETGVPKKDIGIQKNKKTPFGQEVSVI